MKSIKVICCIFLVLMSAVSCERQDIFEKMGLDGGIDGFYITSSIPSPGTNLGPDSIIEVFFSQPVDSSTINASSVSLRRDYDQLDIAIVLTVDGNKLTVEHPVLDIGTGYTLKIYPAVKDMSGKTLEKDYICSFVVSAGGSFAFTGSSIDANSTSVKRSAVIIVNFNTIINISTVNASTLFLEKKNGTIYNAAAAVFEATGNTITVKPQVALDASSDYRIRITPAVKNTSGAGLAFEQQINFFTTPAGTPKWMGAPVGTVTNSSPSVSNVDNTVQIGSAIGYTVLNTATGTSKAFDGSYGAVPGTGLINSSGYSFYAAIGTPTLQGIDYINANPNPGILLFTPPTIGLANGSPTITAAGQIIIGTNSGMIYTVETNGNTSSTPSGAGSIPGGIIRKADGSAYFFSSGMKFYGFTAGLTTLTPFPKDYTPETVDGTPAFSNDESVVYIASSNSSTVLGALHAINTATGVEKTGNWPVPMALTTFSPVVGPDDVVYMGDSTGNVYAINFDGTTKWTINVGASSFATSAIIGADGYIYACTESHSFYCISPAGAVVWIETIIPGSIVSPPSMDNSGVIYFATNDGFLNAIFTDSPGPAAGCWPMFMQNAQHTGHK